MVGDQDKINFERIKEAIEYIIVHSKTQPNLDEVAQHINLSPYHFQRIFTQWAGVSPKRFLQYISIEHAKSILRKPQTTLFDVADEVGLSGTGRLHDLFVSIEGMTPGEYKNGGECLFINYTFFDSLFGHVLVASTHKGICYLGFADDEETVLSELRSLFPHATYSKATDHFQQHAMLYLADKLSDSRNIKLHVKATDFQLKVWQALLKIPMGKLSSYGGIAQAIDNPRSGQAVGTAVGHNPVSILIPCHRVIRASGILGEYHWGAARKAAIIGWENALIYE